LNDVGVYGIVKKGLSEMNNKMMIEFFKDDPEILSVKHIQFSLVPKINAVSRIGDHDERKLIFNALINKNDIKPVTVRHKGQDGRMHTESVDMGVYERAKRMLDKVKGRQDRLVKKALKDIEWLTDGSDGFNAVVLDKKFDKGITGLVANKLLGNTKQPTLVLKRNGNRFDGSGRFPQNINGLKLLQSVNAFAAGHEQAFGVAFTEDQFDEVSKAIETASEQAPDYVYQVDGAFVNEIPSLNEIREIYQKSVLFRGAKDEIQLAILGLKVSKKDIVLKNNWLKIKVGDVVINDFNATDEIKHYVNVGFGDKCFSFVANAGFNFWGREPTPTLIAEKMVPSEGVTVAVSKNNFVF